MVKWLHPLGLAAFGFVLLTLGPVFCLEIALPDLAIVCVLVGGVLLVVAMVVEMARRL